MAIAERRLAAEFNRDGHDIVDHWTYVIASDGDLQEGIASEAASLAGHLRLRQAHRPLRRQPHPARRADVDGLVGGRPEALRGVRLARASGSRTATTSSAIEAAITRPREDDRPSLIAVRTHIGFGSPNKQDIAEGARLAARPGRGPPHQGGLRLGPGQDVLRPGRGARGVPRGGRGAARSSSPTGSARLSAYDDAHPRPGRGASGGGSPASCATAGTPGSRRTRPATEVATRNASQDAIQALAGPVPGAVRRRRRPVRVEPDRRQGRAATSAPTSRAQPPLRRARARHGRRRERHRLPRRVHPVRRDVPDVQRLHARGRAAGARSPGLHVIHVWTHDSVGLGEDGPTHQPVEHYAALRAIPNLWFVRPGDANETSAAWALAVERRDGPVALALTRQKLPVLAGTAEKAREGVRRGGYVLRDAGGRQRPRR